jgi:hypothetical protein
MPFPSIILVVALGLRMPPFALACLLISNIMTIQYRLRYDLTPMFFGLRTRAPEEHVEEHVEGVWVIRRLNRSKPGG